MKINIEIPDGWSVHIWPTSVDGGLLFRSKFMVELRCRLSHRDWTYVDIAGAENPEGLQVAVDECVTKTHSAMREAGDLV